MRSMTATDPKTLAGEDFVSVTTFRRNGTPVPTPVWCADDNGSLAVFSEADSGKVKRIRHDAHVLVAPCSARGKELGPALTGEAVITEDTAHVETLLAAKYGWMWTAYHRLMATVRWIRRQPTPKAVAIEITLGPPVR